MASLLRCLPTKIVSPTSRWSIGITNLPRAEVLAQCIDGIVEIDVSFATRIA